MYRFIESIQLRDGEFKRLPLHQARVTKTMACFYPNEKIIDLESLLANCSYPPEGLFKCRVVYDSEVQLVEFVPYVRREIRSLRLVETSLEPTPYKFEDRIALNAAFARRGDCDDIVLVRDGLLTDSSYSNIALYDGANWYTPRLPLLYGTNRADLLEKGLLTERDIRVDDLKNYTHIALFNAMMEFGKMVLGMDVINNLYPSDHQ